MCDTQDGQWRFDNRNECVKVSGRTGWAIFIGCNIVDVDVDVVVSFSVFAIGTMIVTCECECLAIAKQRRKAQNLI